MKLSVSGVADVAGARLVGDGGREIRGVADLETATPSDVVFVERDADLPRALASGAGAIIAGEFAAGAATDTPLLIAAQPKLSFVRVAARFHPPERQPPGIHPTAVIDRTATLGPGVSVQAHAVIGEHAAVGDRTQIGAGAVVGAGVRLGADCDIKAHVVIYPSTTIGARVIVHAGAVLGSDGFGFVRDAATGTYEKFPQIGRLEIEDDVEIGAGTTVDRGALGATVIGRGTKLDNLVHVGHNVQIGSNVVIAAQTGIGGSSVIEDGVMIGGQAGLADHCRIGRGVILGGQAGVLTGKEIRGEGVVFWGVPARPLPEYLKQLAALARFAKRRDGPPR